jgi:hypothetical protein
MSKTSGATETFPVLQVPDHERIADQAGSELQALEIPDLMELSPEDLDEVAQAVRTELQELDTDTEPKIYLREAEKLLKVAPGWCRPHEKTGTQDDCTRQTASLELVYAHAAIGNPTRAHELIDEELLDPESILPSFLAEGDNPIRKREDYKAVAEQIIARGVGFDSLIADTRASADRVMGGAILPKQTIGDFTDDWFKARAKALSATHIEGVFDNSTPKELLKWFIEQGPAAVAEAVNVVSGIDEYYRGTLCLATIRAISEFAIGRQNQLLSEIL